MAIPQFDTQFLSAALAAENPAGQAAFHDLMLAQWPQSVLNLMGAAAQMLGNSLVRTSSTSATISLGAKSFTASAPSGFVMPAGTPFLVTADADPSNTWMWGKMTADETNEGVIALNVEIINGSGSYTAWTLTAITLIPQLIDPIVSRAQGGWGVNMETAPAQGRAAVEVPHSIIIYAAVDSVPGSPVAGRYYLSKFTGSGFIADYIYKWTGSSWEQAIVDFGSFVYILSTEPGVTIIDDIAVLAVTVEDSALYPGSQWQLIGRYGPPRRRKPFVLTDSGSPHALTQLKHQGSFIEVDATVGNVVLTLPHPNNDMVEMCIFRADSSGNTVTVDVAAGGSIVSGGVAASSVAVAALSYVNVIKTAAGFWLVNGAG